MECKRLYKVRKANRQVIDRPFSSALSDHLPPRPMCDKLIRLYIKNFESCYRLFHVPTLRAMYAAFWDNPKGASPAFTAQLLLICALGSYLYDESDVGDSCLRSLASHCIAAAKSWLTSPNEKSRLNIPSLMAHCLFILANQAHPEGDEMVWIHVGSLLRYAMRLGLHRDPSRISTGLSYFEIEWRRRLWAVILDLQVQSSLESGGPPLISWQDFDCQPPSNIDDTQLDPHDTASLPIPKHDSVFTDSSMHCALMRTLPIRLQIVKYLNNLRSEPIYDKTLELGTRLQIVLDDNTPIVLDSCAGQTQQPSAFQTKVFQILTQRFVLALHHPFAIQAKSNPEYYFSRKICLDLSLSLLHYVPGDDKSLSSSSNSSRFVPQSTADDGFTRLRLMGSGLYRDVHLRAIVFVCIELFMQFDDGRTHYFSSPYCSLNRKELHKVVAQYVSHLAQRIEAGEINVSGYISFSCVLAKLEALEASRPPKPDILVAMRRSLELCYRVLKKEADSLNTPILPAANINPVSAGLTNNPMDVDSGVSDTSNWLDFVSWALFAVTAVQFN